MAKIYPALNERIALALCDHFNMNEQLLNEISKVVNLVIEEYSEDGLPFVKENKDGK